MEKKDYEKFIENFGRKVDEINPSISFYIYGSYLRKDFTPGVSDLDGFLVMNDYFITDQNELSLMSMDLENALYDSNPDIKVQFNVLDKGNSNDGRFLAYSKDYTDYLKKNSKKIWGSYNLENLNGIEYKHSELSSISHNLHKLRQNFLYWDNNQSKNNFESIKKTVYSPLHNLARLPKQIINLVSGNLVEDKTEALQEFKKYFPTFETGFIRGIDDLLKDNELYNNFPERERCYAISKDCLTEMERIIGMYVERFPEPNSREFKI
jgi:predicted nucleotidyltransferase